MLKSAKSFRGIALAALLVAVTGGSVWLVEHYEPKLSQAEQTARQPSEKEAVDILASERVAYYTMVLAAFTGALSAFGVVQLIFLVRADDTARISAKAAQTAAEAIPIMERPYIFIHGIHGVEAVPQDKFIPRIVYNVSNNGKLAAKIENIKIRFGLISDGLFPPLIIQGDHPLLQRPIMSSDEKIHHLFYNLTGSNLINRRGVSQTQREEYDLADGAIFQVVISYRGPFTRDHETGQCWRYNASLDGFIEVDDPRYTYTN